MEARRVSEGAAGQMVQRCASLANASGFQQTRLKSVGVISGSIKYFWWRKSGAAKSRFSTSNARVFLKADFRFVSGGVGKFVLVNIEMDADFSSVFNAKVC
jgi:hypothetical protein